MGHETRNGEILACELPPVDRSGFGNAPAYARRTEPSASYEPGSTFKADHDLRGARERLVTPGTVFSVPPVLHVADRTIHDAEGTATRA